MCRVLLLEGGPREEWETSTTKPKPTDPKQDLGPIVSIMQYCVPGHPSASKLVGMQSFLCRHRKSPENKYQKGCERGWREDEEGEGNVIIF